MTFPNAFIRQWRRHSLGLALAALSLLALLSVLTAVALTQASRGEANALNMSGSLRMLSWRVAAAAFQDDATLQTAATEFEQRLATLQDDARRFASGHEAAGELATDITRTWHERLRPLTQPVSGLQRDARNRALMAEMPAFVTRLDRLVRLIEQDLESKIQWLRIMLGALLLSMLLVAALTYARQEARVAEKTREIRQNHHSLQLLYRTASRLSEGELTQEKLLELLSDVERELGLGPGIICVRQEEEERAYPLATRMPETQRAALCDTLGCSICFGGGGRLTSINVHEMAGLHLVSVPLTGGGQWQGVMPFQLQPGQALEPWQAQVLETIGRHVATALANTRRAEERHRLAVLEERSVIARELHDSIAQTLSYLKIQIALLQSRLGALPHPDDLLDTVEELKVGLGTAYSELRELLTTFRLAPGQTPFTEELAQMVQELSRRCGHPIELEQHMGSMQLSANEEIHLTSIIREALINIQRHAHAAWARVSLTADTLRRVDVVIEDDGVGIPQTLPERHHYGLTIMRDRAAILQGQLRVTARPQGGTRVHLGFVANTPYAQELKAS
ncbi:MAG: type IV pili methyl-accepting chemotaxis transducer N-terminal domain-containing protein [Betaproteobacteria bacterium]|nr:type IV pili methyl-accepting chemotaxis transducer N-terminal domain-containing protein [Betaproteobacteria bacterium]